MARNRNDFLVHSKRFVLSDNWAEPYVLDELAVDRKKITDISSWLSGHRNKSGILLVTGPTGCGKTSAVKCVARSLGFEIREWVTPLDRDYEKGMDSGLYQSQSEKFEDFLYSCSRYSDLFAISSSSLLLVEDYPNAFLLKPESFHDVLGNYKKSARAPLVFICSDAADKILNIELQLFPLSVQERCSITHITLNPVTRAKMLLALKRMCAMLQTITPSYKPPSQETLNEIANSSNGDVRYAMLSLQIKPQEDVAAIFDLAGKKGLSRKKASAQRVTQEEEMVATCGKDDRVGILRAVARVLYPKWRSESERPVLNAAKRKRKETEAHLDAGVHGAVWVHDPNSIVDSYTSAAHQFLLLVQENYLKTFSSIESATAAAHYLSDSDVMMSGEGFEATHEISFDVGVRGVMVHNRKPHRAFTAVKGSRNREINDIQKKLAALTDGLFSFYPVNHTVLMAEIIPYMSHCCRDSLSNDQRRFVDSVASLRPLTHFFDTFMTFKKPHDYHLDKASFVIDPAKAQKAAEVDDELHISEDESEEEVDEGAENLSMLEAVLAEDEELDEGAQNLALLETVILEEEREQLDYHALLNDSEDDEILLSQM